VGFLDQRLPVSRVVIIDGGHFLWEEAPAQYASAVLARLPAAGHDAEELVMTQEYRTLRVAPTGKGVLGVVMDAPPMNLIGPELVRDLVSLFGELESGRETRVVVLESADPDYFVPHVDLTKVAEYTAEAAKAGGPDDGSLGMLWHKLSELPVVTIAKIRGRARGAGSELALACDMRFAARENAILGQIEAGVGATPGAGGVQHLARLLGRGRAMEAILGADDFDAEIAERYGWINRALPDADLDAFVARLARRIASFPADAVLTAKRVLNELTMPGADAIRADARRFHQLVVSDTAHARTATLFAEGLQTRGPLELDLGDRLEAPAAKGDLP
jgi:enoyl-CoA hydratase/carnithine racemase